jgi:hypothetical protein
MHTEYAILGVVVGSGDRGEGARDGHGDVGTLTARRRPGGVVCRALAALALAALALAAGPLLAVASTDEPDEPDAAEAVLTVTAALSTEHDVGDRVAVRVTVAADRLIDGAVVARVGPSLSIRRDVQVAGGSTEEWWLLVPSADLNGSDLRVDLLDGTDTVDTDSVRFSHDSSTDVAGLLPRLVALGGEPPARATLAGDLRRVNLVAIPDGLLQAGAGALDQLDVVGATSADLTRLDDAGRAVLFSWIDQGGQLVLDDTADLDALPAEWRPGEAGYVLAGRGEIRVADGLLAAGAWDEALAPTALSVMDSPTGFSGVDMLIDPRLTLSQRAGVQLPDLTTIIGVLGGYVVVVGPIMYLVLRRARRLTAAWVLIPAVAVLVGAGVVLTGAGWRSSGRPTANVVAQSSAVGTHTMVEALVFRRSGGTASVALPAGWTAAGRSQFGWFGDSTASATLVESSDSPRLETRLEPGQIAVLGAEGHADETLLDVVAEADADGITGTVTNTTTVALRSVAVFAAGRAVLVGDLGAGQSATFAIDDPVERPDPYSSALGTVWPQVNSVFGPDGASVSAAQDGVDLGVWTSFASQVTDDLYPMGYVRAAGWTDELASPTGASFSATTLVTRLAPIGVAADGATPPTAVRWGWISSPFDPNTGVLSSPVLRYVLPQGAAVDGVTISLPTAVTSIDALGPDGKWKRLRDSATERDAVDVPSDHVILGAVVIRLKLDPGMGIDPAQVVPVLQGEAS